MKRRIVAAGLMAVTALITSGAQAAMPTVTPVDVETVPRGADLSVAWIDEADRTIHASGATIPTGLDRPAYDFRSVSGGYLVERIGGRLFHVSTSGARTDLGQVLRYVVRTGRYAGSQFVIERRTANGYRLEVRRSSDLKLLRTRTSATFFNELDFHDGLLWVKSGRWNVSTGAFSTVGKLVRARAEDIEARANAFAGRALSDGSLVVSPLYGTPWRAWRARNASVLGWSPDGRFVVLRFANDDQPWDDYLEVRNLRTGARVARFSGTFTSHVKWEDATHFLVEAAELDTSSGGLTVAPPTAVVRLGIDGSARRASELVGPDDADGPYVQLVSERS